MIDAAPKASGMTYSGWLAATARKELLIREGLEGGDEFEREHGALTEAELGRGRCLGRPGASEIAPEREPSPSKCLVGCDLALRDLVDLVGGEPAPSASSWCTSM